MDKNDVGAGFVPLKIGDTVQKGDQIYSDFSWLPVPKRKIGTVLQRMHWPMRRKAEEVARPPMTYMGEPVDLGSGSYTSTLLPIPGSPEDKASLAELDSLIPPAPAWPGPEDFAKSPGAQILQQDFQTMEEKIHGTLASLGLLHLLPKPFSPNKYTRDLLALDGRKVPVDVYCVLAAFPVGNAAVDHALKKLLAPGQRGQKDRLQDLKEARASLDRAIQMEGG